ncbi:MAG: glycogen synthase GlgA [Deltaproteobacteria bacterium]|nr:glycogen synthase GlgA [Deltaproteobacteria bacterium]
MEKQKSASRSRATARRGRPKRQALHITMVSPEIMPFAKTGGLADMVGSLCPALEKLGLKVSPIMPAYRPVLKGSFPLTDTGLSFAVPVADHKEEASVFKATLGENTTAYFIRCDRYFDREALYSTSEGNYPDNAERFVFFSRAALEVLRQHPPDILHCHDWQTALAIVFLKAQPDRYPELASVKTVLTVHNLGYQGLFWYLDWHLLNLDESLFNPAGLEFFGKINFLKGGVISADGITTVSPTYAEEIKSPEQGFGLEGIFHERAKDLVGILNGADYTIWSPETDRYIAKNYSAKDLAGKKTCKAELQRAAGLPQRADVPLVGMVSRLISQKGLDLLESCGEDFLARDLQFVLLGNGEAKYEVAVRELAARYPTKASVRIGFDEALAHQIEAGADFFLMPSQYEPCGLNQLYSLKYGTIPIVRATGGLKDSVKDCTANSRGGTGFVFGPYEPAAFLDALDRGLSLFAVPKGWTALVKRAMAADFSWDRSARAYADLYQRLVS